MIYYEFIVKSINDIARIAELKHNDEGEPIYHKKGSKIPFSGYAGLISDTETRVVMGWKDKFYEKDGGETFYVCIDHLFPEWCIEKVIGEKK